MSYAFDGTNDRITGTLTTARDVPITIAAWIKGTWRANDAFVQLGNGGGSNNASVALVMDGTTNNMVARAVDDAGASGGGAEVVFDISAVGTTYNETTGWVPVIVVFASDSSRTIYIGSDANTATSTTARATTGAFDEVRLGEDLAGGTDLLLTGMAEVGMWASVLDAGQRADFYAGVTPDAIGTPFGYWDLRTSNATQANLGSDATGDLTVTGATFSADHPSMFTTWALSGTLVAAGSRLTAVPDIVSGGSIQVTHVTGGSLDDVEIFADGSFAVYNEAITSFSARGNNNNGDGWGAAGIQEFAGLEDAISESGSATDAYAPTGTLNSAVSESRTATDANAATIRTGVSITETVTTTDSLSSTSTIPTQAISETAVAASTVANTSTQNVSVTGISGQAIDLYVYNASAHIDVVLETETLTESDSHASVLTAKGVLAESGAATATHTTSITGNRAITETGSLSVTHDTTGTLARDISEEAVASDTYASGQILVDSVDESGSATDAHEALIDSFSAAIEETGSATDTQANTADQAVAVSETAVSADAVAGAGAIYQSDVLEEAASTDSLTESADTLPAVLETTEALDSMDDIVDSVELLTEATEATDVVEVMSALLVTLEVDETLDALDELGNYLDSEVVLLSEELTAVDSVDAGITVSEPPPSRIGQGNPGPRKDKPDKPGRKKFTVE